MKNAHFKIIFWQDFFGKNQAKAPQPLQIKNSRILQEFF